MEDSARGTSCRASPLLRAARMRPTSGRFAFSLGTVPPIRTPSVSERMYPPDVQPSQYIRSLSLGVRMGNGSDVGDEAAGGDDGGPGGEGDDGGELGRWRRGRVPVP